MSASSLPMRLRALAAAAGVLSAPAAADAQLFSEFGARVAPLAVQYRFAAPLDQTITEFAVPIYLSTLVIPGLSVDLGTAVAQSMVDYPRADSTRATSRISGLTDTQLRAHYTIGQDMVILTAGLNLPTGRATASTEQLPAASLIASDFLYFPVSNFGTGLGWTGGLAVARPFGAWNLGAGASVRMSTAYEPFELEQGQRVRFQPGNEYRARVGVDRTVGDGRIALGLTYSTFGADELPGDATSSVYNTGDRVIGQASWSTPSPAGDLAFSVWNLYRGRGEQSGGTPAPWENIANVAVALGRQLGAVRLEPNVQFRHWLQRVEATETSPGYTAPSSLVELGLATGFRLGGVSLRPSGAFTVGRVATALGADANLTGFRVQLSTRLP